MDTTAVIEELSVSYFNKKLKDKPAVVGIHALKHLSSGQREVFSAEDLLRIATENKPRRVGRQRNGALRVTYRRKDGFYVLIFAEKYNRMEIVTYLKPKTSRK